MKASLDLVRGEIGVGLITQKNDLRHTSHIQNSNYDTDVKAIKAAVPSCLYRLWFIALYQPYVQADLSLLVDYVINVAIINDIKRSLNNCLYDEKFNYDIIRLIRNDFYDIILIFSA